MSKAVAYFGAMANDEERQILKDRQADPGTKDRIVAKIEVLLVQRLRELPASTWTAGRPKSLDPKKHGVGRKPWLVHSYSHSGFLCICLSYFALLSESQQD